MYINGEFRTEPTGEIGSVINPATGEVVEEVAMGGPAETNEAIEAANRAYDEEWSDWSARDRGEVLREMAAILEETPDEVARLETLENGKPLDQSHNDVNAAVEALEFYAGAADKFHGDTIPEKLGVMDMTVHEPYGVVGVILPWNWPPMHVCDFAAPALAAGNTVVIKPSSQTPLATMELARLWDGVLPDGVFNVVVGSSGVGSTISGHPDVGKLGFTGSTWTGGKILESAAENITSAMMELGGKNPSIVFPDADLEKAASRTVNRAFYNCGEACSSPERLLVHEDVHDEVVEHCVEAAARVTLGNGLDNGVDMGPLASKEQYDKITEAIEVARNEGAELVFSGETPDDPELQDGFFVGPAIFDGVTRDMKLFQEEVFGPVLAVTTFESEEEAIDLANDTKYGLTGGVWTTDSERSMRVARSIEAGLVYVNNFMHGILGTPFGGYKRSGMGRKLAFEETMREFTRVKSIRYSLGE